jgi:hypothetical protein
MTTMMNLAQFAGLMMHLANTLPSAQRHTLDLIGRIVETEARALIGTYDYRPRWPELAEATKEERSAQGLPENEPLLRTGGLRDSIHHHVDGDTVHVGSDDDKAVWQELGTIHIPPRTFLKGAVLNTVELIEHVTGETIHAHLSSGVYPSSTGHPFNRHDDTIK